MSKKQNKQPKTYDILVFNLDGRRMLNTTRERAELLVRKNSAKWVGGGAIEMLTYRDRASRQRLRKMIAESDNYTCYICGVGLTNLTSVTLDHVLPKGRYGANSFKNQRCCCARCNQDKGCRTIGEYYDYVCDNPDQYTHLQPEQLRKMKEVVLFYEPNHFLVEGCQN